MDIKRKIQPLIQSSLERGKSVFLLGPRQTGKTTLVEKFIKPDVSISFASLETRSRYEKDPAQFEKDIQYRIKEAASPLIIFVDEVQKIPAVLDSIQYIIDKKEAQFILSGSSARKLKQTANINLLPGRVVNLTMDALVYSELPDSYKNLETMLTYGSLPGIVCDKNEDLRENDLIDYVSTYLEDEIRQEALVRNIGAFSRFLELAALESGNMINFTKISQDVGVSDYAIKEYFQILEDCLITFKVTPITKSKTRKRLLKAPKYLFFDLGVRRSAANEGSQVSIKQYANWFEQYVGIELVRYMHINKLNDKLCYWRDVSGVEVDFVVDREGKYIPIEVKWSEAPKEKDARHLDKFISEYDCNIGYIVCRTPTPYRLNEKISVIPWEMISKILE